MEIAGLIEHLADRDGDRVPCGHLRQADEQVAKHGERLERPRRKCPLRDRALQLHPQGIGRDDRFEPGGQQRRQFRRRAQLLEALHHAAPDPASGHVDHAPQAHVVEGIDDQFQVRQRVLDLLAFVEPDAADDLVRHALAHQRIFDRARLRVDAVEDGDHRLGVFRQGPPAGPRDEVGFFQLVAPAVEQDAGAAFLVGPEPLGLAVPVAADHRRRGVQDDLRGAIVPLEPHHRGVREVVLEIQDVLQVRPAPLIDRLVGIADDTDVAVPLGQATDQHVLRAVGVLVLVDHHLAELVRIPRPDVLGLLHQLDGLQQQVVEIERVTLLQRVQVVPVDLRDLFVARVPAPVEHFGALHQVLRVTDAGEGGARLHERVVDVQLLHRLLDDRQLIGGVVDHEVARQADGGCLAPEQPRRQRVERRDPHLRAVGTQQRRDARAHLFGGLVGERHGEDAIGRRQTRRHDVRDPVGDHTGLARSGARQNQDGAVGLQHGVALLGIES